MEEKIKILFVNRDVSGVNYYRTLTPAMEIEREHKDFFVEINAELDFKLPETIEYAKTFNIIHYHTNLLPKLNEMRNVVYELKKFGVIMVLDIDDYWELNKNHPQYQMFIETKAQHNIIENIKLADYVTTTTDIFADEIKKLTGKDNVISLPNSVDPDWMKQFQNNWKPSLDGKVRITYVGGSSHLNDLKQIDGVTNMLNADFELKDKFKIILAGWDSNGNTTEIKFNEEFGEELKKTRFWNKKVLDILTKTRGNIDAVPNIPVALADKYRGNIFNTTNRKINANESVYLKYEDILTDKHKIIKDVDYNNWLMTFQENGVYLNDIIFKRIWTQKANTYANVLNETDIVIAPLDDNKFNSMKSNLKQVECWSRKLPIVCTDIPPYNVDGKHMENCILIPFSKSPQREWKKQIKKLILDSNLRKQLGEKLYEDFSVKYNLKTVTNKRTDFYKEIIEQNKNNENGTI